MDDGKIIKVDLPDEGPAVVTKLEPNAKPKKARSDAGGDSSTPIYPSPAEVDLRPYIPPRKVIYRDFIRGYLTGTAGTGGSGKTALLDVEIVSLCLGKDLFSPRVAGERVSIRAGSQRVLVLSLEDDVEEFRRRQRAIVERYCLSDEEQELLRENCKVVFDHDGVLKIAQTVERKVIPNNVVRDHIKECVTEHDASVLVIDPLVSLHSVDENSNIEMQSVATLLRGIARSLGIAVHYIHHNRKGGDNTADSMRGAVALRDASRKLRMVARVPRDKAMSDYLADESIAGNLMGVTNGKANFEPLSGDVTLYQFYSVDLHNATEEYASDKVGVVAVFDKPDLFHDIPVTKCEAAWRDIQDAPESERRDNFQAGGWAGHLIGKALGIDSRDQSGRKRVKSIIDEWVKSGQLERYQAVDAKARRPKPFLRFCGEVSTDE